MVNALARKRRTFRATIKDPALLLLTAVDVVGWLAPLLPEWLQAMLPWRLPLAFLQMPLLHAYGRQLCFPGRPMRRLWWLAGLQLLAVLVALLLGLRYRGGIDLPGLALHVQFYAYFIALVVLLRRYRRVYAQTCSNPGSITGPWLTVVLVVVHVVVAALHGAFSGGGVL